MPLFLYFQPFLSLLLPFKTGLCPSVSIVLCWSSCLTSWIRFSRLFSRKAKQNLYCKSWKSYFYVITSKYVVYVLVVRFKYVSMRLNYISQSFSLHTNVRIFIMGNVFHIGLYLLLLQTHHILTPSNQVFHCFLIVFVSITVYAFQPYAIHGYLRMTHFRKITLKWEIWTYIFTISYQVRFDVTASQEHLCFLNISFHLCLPRFNWFLSV